MSEADVTLGDEPLVFQSGIESFHKSLKGQLTPDLKAEIKRLGIDLERPQPAVSLAVWENMMARVAARLHPDLPEADRYFALGRQFMHGYAETTLGGAVVTLARVMGVRRTMHRMGKNFRTIANYIEVEVKELGEKKLELQTWMRPEHLARHKRPTLIFANYRRGVLQETLELLGATGTVSIAQMDQGKQRVVFSVEWQ